jgi:hypothetical protein
VDPRFYVTSQTHEDLPQVLCTAGIAKNITQTNAMKF